MSLMQLLVFVYMHFHWHFSYGLCTGPLYSLYFFFLSEKDKEKKYRILYETKMGQCLIFKNDDEIRDKKNALFAGKLLF